MAMTGFKLFFREFPRPLFLVLLLALAIRIVYLVIYASLPDWDLLTVDNYYHKNWSEDIASGNLFGDTTYFRAPFYIYCLSALSALFGFSLGAARIFGLVIGLVSIFLTYKIASILFSRRVAVVACVIQAIFPAVLYFESELLFDSLFMLLLELSFFSFLKWYDDADSRNSWWLGLSLGLAAITRPTILIFLLPLLALMLLKYNSRQLKLKNFLVFAAGLAIIILPISIRNLAVGNEFVLIASQGGINFYIGNNSNADGLSAVMPEPLGHNWLIKDITYIAEKEAGRELKPGEVSNFWFKKALTEISAEPFQFVKLFIKKVYFNISNREISNNRNLNDFFGRHLLLKFNPLSFGILFSLAVLGIVMGWPAHWGIRLLSVVILIYILAVSLFFFNSRFRLPILPLYFILAAAGIESLVYRFNESKKSVVIPLTAALIGGVISFYPLISLPQGNATQHLTMSGLKRYFENDFKAALPYFREAVLANPEFPDNNLNMGACHLRLGNADSALFYFGREKEFHPKRVSSYSNIASVYILQNRPNEALAEVTTALELRPYHELSQLIRLRAAAQLENEIKTDSLFRMALGSISESKHNIAALNFAAITLTNRNALAEAKILLSKAIALAPPPIEMSDDAFTPAFKSAVDNFAKEKALANYQLGFIYALEGNFSESVKRSRAAILLDSNLVEAYVNLSNALTALGNFSAADSVLQIARARFPQSNLFK